MTQFSSNIESNKSKLGFNTINYSKKIPKYACGVNPNGATISTYSDDQIKRFSRVKPFPKIIPNNEMGINNEIFMHGALFQLMIPEYVVPMAIDWGATMFSFEPEIGEGSHALIKLDEEGQAMLHDTITSSFGCIGTIMKVKGSKGQKFLDIERYDVPHQSVIEMVNEVKSGKSPSFNITIIGMASRMHPNHVYLLNNRFEIIAQLIDPRRQETLETLVDKIKHPLQRYSMGWDYDLNRPVDDSPSDMGFTGDDLTLRMVTTFIDQRFTHSVEPNLKFPLEVNNEIISRLNNIKLSMDKKMLLDSPFLNKGVTFTIKVNKNKIREISVWKENQNVVDKKIHSASTINVYIREWEYNEKGITLKYIGQINEKKVCTDLYWYFFDYDELPDKLDDKTILKFFKKRSMNNKDSSKQRIKEEEDYIKEKFGFDSNLDDTLLRYTAQLSFFKQAVLARNFCRINFDTGNFEERGNQQEILTMIIKLICAYCDPNLRGKIKQLSSKPDFNKRFSINNKRNQPKLINKWEWGTDRIWYISPPKTKGNKLNVRTYVYPHFGTYYVKNIEKYKEKLPLKLDTPINNRNYSVNLMKLGFWKGDGEKLKFPKYYAGKRKNGNSRIAIHWLEEIMQQEDIFIQHENNLGELRIPNSPYRVDGFCEETNTIYEYHGCYWHGCSKCQPNRNKVHPVSKKTMEQLYRNTLRRDKFIKSLGYNYVVKWGCNE